MASEFRYEDRLTGPVGVTSFAYSVRVKFGRQVFLIIRDQIESGSAYVWEEERFGTGEVKWNNSKVIEEAIEVCLKDFTEAIRIDPGHAEAYLNRGKERASRGSLKVR